MNKLLGLWAILLWISFGAQAQVEDEDFDQYAEAEFVGNKAKTYANAKIIGLSPQRFVSIGFEMHGPHNGYFSSIGSYSKDQKPVATDSARFAAVYLPRIYANIPIISKNTGIWQLGLNYMESQYSRSSTTSKENALSSILAENGLRTTGLFSTFYKPISEKAFWLFQAQADLSGDYSWQNIQALRYVRYSGAIMWGKRPHDRKQWAIGVARTYRVGAMNYIPVVMYNVTDKAGKWGAEILFPARGHARYQVNTKSMFLFGYELEGQSYRIAPLSKVDNSFEIRRGELKPRIEYQRQLKGFFWLSLQAGVRLNYAFDADELPNGKEFFRGFFGNQPFAMKNQLSPAPYGTISINFVSP